LGAEVVVSAGKKVAWRRVHTDGSYASANDPRVLLGLGDAQNAGENNLDRLEVRWPDGTLEEWSGVETGQYETLRQGEGTLINGK